MSSDSSDHPSEMSGEEDQYYEPASSSSDEMDAELEAQK